jgi:RecA/RadA recombinase
VLKKALAKNQMLGGLSIFYDSEGAYNPEFFEVVGGNCEALKVCTGFTVEDFFSELTALCDHAIKQAKEGNQMRIAVGWDSVANTLTRNLVKDGLDKKDFSKAIAMSEGCKMLGSKLREARICLIATNQMRVKIGASEWELNAHEPGGYAFKHYASQRLELAFAGFSGSILKTEDDVSVGRKIKGTITKNRAGPSNRQFHFQIWTESGHPHPEFEGVPTEAGVSEDEAAMDYYFEPYAVFGIGKTPFITSAGGGGWHVFHPDVVKALGKPADWKFAKFRKKQWLEIMADAPMLKDCNFMVDQC